MRLQIDIKTHKTEQARISSPHTSKNSLSLSLTVECEKNVMLGHENDDDGEDDSTGRSRPEHILFTVIKKLPEKFLSPSSLSWMAEISPNEM